MSEKDDKGKWSRPEAVTGGLNTAYDEGVCSFSPDGREMYLTQCVTDPPTPATPNREVDACRCRWGKATEVKLTNDTLSSYAHPALSPDGEWLYFTSDMPGGKGGLDIWRVRITATGFGGVGKPRGAHQHRGRRGVPDVQAQRRPLFLEQWHPGLGGLDIFIAKVGKDGRYHLTHPGYPLNSQGDDFGMTFEGPYNRGFFSSNRGDGRGWDHIYAFENPEIVQTVKGGSTRWRAMNCPQHKCMWWEMMAPTSD
jgi:hypothetical protein